MGVSQGTIHAGLKDTLSESARRNLLGRIQQDLDVRLAAPPALEATLVARIADLLARHGHDVSREKKTEDGWTADLCVDGILIEVKTRKPDDGGEKFLHVIVEGAK